MECEKMEEGGLKMKRLKKIYINFNYEFNYYIYVNRM